ncbi:hypothetical protein ACRRTK_022420 [Alexandromys fortis]
MVASHVIERSNQRRAGEALSATRGSRLSPAPDRANARPALRAFPPALAGLSCLLEPSCGRGRISLLQPPGPRSILSA